MAKKPEPFRFNQMTKAELIKTVKALDKRQTKLLNEIASLKGQLALSVPFKPADLIDMETHSTVPLRRFPWETGDKLPNPFEGEK